MSLDGDGDGEREREKANVYLLGKDSHHADERELCVTHGELAHPQMIIGKLDKLVFGVHFVHNLVMHATHQSQ